MKRIKTSNTINTYTTPVALINTCAPGFFLHLACATVLVFSTTANADIYKDGINTISTNNTLDKLLPVGHARYTWFGLSIYHASLSTSSGTFENIVDSLPIALTITYERNIDSEDLAERTVEEWERLNIFNNEKRTYWKLQLTRIWPDVKPNDSITTYVNQDKYTYFYHNDSLLTVVNDQEFGPAMLAIWLDSKTSEPDMRASLIGQGDN